MCQGTPSGKGDAKTVSRRAWVTSFQRPFFISSCWAHGFITFVIFPFPPTLCTGCKVYFEGHSCTSSGQDPGEHIIFFNLSTPYYFLCTIDALCVALTLTPSHFCLLLDALNFYTGIHLLPCTTHLPLVAQSYEHFPMFIFRSSSSQRSSMVEKIRLWHQENQGRCVASGKSHSHSELQFLHLVSEADRFPAFIVGCFGGPLRELM